ncbi:MAG TPA: N-acetyl-gamma-glutamyl-phosphate reductase [Terriglobales bacterium]|nr:N-acetyl-gamma-glutamyl-phosphate reductase [Terriglobales bacterium]
MPAKLKTAVLGASGYAGLELTRLLGQHPRLEKPLLLGRGEGGQAADLAEAFPELSGNGGYPLEPFSLARLKQASVELLFLATPHQTSRRLVPELWQQGIRVIDLSGAWRLDRQENRSVYEFEDQDTKLAEEITRQRVYGLPELHSDEIAEAVLVANPGCYATSVILGLAPLLAGGLVERERGIISDSKSGVSGAGTGPTARTHFVAVADNLSAYGVFRHRHLGEMLEQLELKSEELIFTPHLLPIPRGILSTIYVYLSRAMTVEEVERCYRSFYAGRHWVRIFSPPKLPELRYSLHSNYCDLGFCLGDDRRRLVVVSCVDNLRKGAAGQAVQNMNLMFGWDEAEGLQ